MDKETTKTAPAPPDKPHVLLRVSLLSQQYCTSGTKTELAQHILGHLADTLGEYMFRYSVQDIEERLSEPVQCESHPDRRHYLFDAGRLSYLP